MVGLPPRRHSSSIFSLFLFDIMSFWCLCFVCGKRPRRPAKASQLRVSSNLRPHSPLKSALCVGLWRKVYPRFCLICRPEIKGETPRRQEVQSAAPGWTSQSLWKEVVQSLFCIYLFGFEWELRYVAVQCSAVWPRFLGLENAPNCC